MRFWVDIWKQIQSVLRVIADRVHLIFGRTSVFALLFIITFRSKYGLNLVHHPERKPKKICPHRDLNPGLPEHGLMTQTAQLWDLVDVKKVTNEDMFTIKGYNLYREKNEAKSRSGAYIRATISHARKEELEGNSRDLVILDLNLNRKYRIKNGY